MPNSRTVEKAKRALAEGKQPSTAAGEFVREEIEHIREGQHGARSAKQVIAIGLSKARRAGVPLKPPKPAQARKSTRRAALKDVEAGRGRRKNGPVSRRRSRASKEALQSEGSVAASHRSLVRHAKSVGARSRTAKKGAATKRAKAKR